jgi:hypothetical protein
MSIGQQVRMLHFWKQSLELESKTKMTDCKNKRFTALEKLISNHRLIDTAQPKQKRIDNV